MKHTLHTRRQFLRTSLLGGAVSWTIPAFLERTFFTLDAMAADSAIQTPTGKDGPILIVLQLAGGNDGLNTLVPFGDDAYFRARPTLAIPGGKTLRLTDHFGLNPKLAGLKSLHDEGHLAIVQGVGYPNPNRSHFRSTEIWHTASDSAVTEKYGWMGRYFDACCKGEDPSIGVSIGPQPPQAFAAPEPRGISFSRPEQFRFDLNNASDRDVADDFFRSVNDFESGQMDGDSIGMLPGHADGEGDALDFLQRTSLDAVMSSDKVAEIIKRTRPGASYPSNRLADSLNLVARLIGGGMPTRVYYVAQGGYDTHSNQAGAHERLMAELDSSLSAFCADLRKGQAGHLWSGSQPYAIARWRYDSQHRLPQRLRDRFVEMAQCACRAGSETKLPASVFCLMLCSERRVDAEACLLSTRGNVRNASHC